MASSSILVQGKGTLNSLLPQQQTYSLHASKVGPSPSASSSVPVPTGPAGGASSSSAPLTAGRTVAPLTETTHMFRQTTGSRNYVTLSPADTAKQQELNNCKYAVKQRLIQLERGIPRQFTEFSFNLNLNTVTFKRRGQLETKDLSRITDPQFLKEMEDFRRVAVEIAGPLARATYHRTPGSVGRHGGAAPFVRSNPIMQSVFQAGTVVEAAKEAVRIHDAHNTPLTDVEKGRLVKGAIFFDKLKTRVAAKVTDLERRIQRATTDTLKQNLRADLKHWKKVQNELNEVDYFALMMGTAYSTSVTTAAKAEEQAQKILRDLGTELDGHHENARGPKKLPFLLGGAWTGERLLGKEDKSPIDHLYVSDVAALPYVKLGVEKGGLDGYQAHYAQQGTPSKDTGLTGMLLAALEHGSGHASRVDGGIDENWILLQEAKIQTDLRNMIKQALRDKDSRTEFAPMYNQIF